MSALDDVVCDLTRAMKRLPKAPEVWPLSAAMWPTVWQELQERLQAEYDAGLRPHPYVLAADIDRPNFLLRGIPVVVAEPSEIVA